MKKIFTLISAALCVIGVNAQESYTAATLSGNTATMATEFSSVVDASGVAANASDGKSIVKISTTNVSLEAVGGTVPASLSGAAQDINSDGSVNSWSPISWSAASQGDISFYYVKGTGNPYTAISAEEIVTDGTPTGTYKAKYTTYLPDGSKGMPISGLYYKFTPKVAGSLKVGVWSNKGNRNTFVVDESTKLPVAYTAEGYINGQNDALGAKKYLTAAQVDSIHRVMKVDSTGTDKAPYVIGGGNQNFWGYVTFSVEAGKSYWLFQDTAQIGFKGFTFTSSATGISEIATDDNAANDGRLFNLAGQVVDKSYRGIVVKKGKKFMQ